MRNAVTKIFKKKADSIAVSQLKRKKVVAL